MKIADVPEADRRRLRGVSLARVSQRFAALLVDGASRLRTAGRKGRTFVKLERLSQSSGKIPGKVREDLYAVRPDAYVAGRATAPPEDLPSPAREVRFGSDGPST